MHVEAQLCCLYILLKNDAVGGKLFNSPRTSDLDFKSYDFTTVAWLMMMAEVSTYLLEFDHGLHSSFINLSINTGAIQMMQGIVVYSLAIYN